MTTLKKIAEEAGVSVFTTSRILSGKSKEVWPAMIERAERVRKVAAKYGYMPNANALAMRRQQAMTIGVLVRNAADRPMHYLAAYEMITGINLRLQPRNYVVLLISIDDVSADLGQTSRVFSERVLDGMIILESLPVEVCDHMAQLMPHCIWLDSNRYESTGCIRRDEIYSGHLAAEKLIQAGWRTIVWMRYGALTPDAEPVNPVPHHFSRDERLKGVRTAVEASGLELVEFDLPHLHENFGAEAFGDLFDRPDIGIVAYDTLMAQRIANITSQIGLRAGHNFGLACCDYTHQTKTTFPGLSGVNIDRFAMGQQAADMMLKMIEDPNIPVKSRVLRGEWIEGQTFGKA